MHLELLSPRLRLTPLCEADVDIAIAMFTDPVVTRYAMDAMSENVVRQEMPTWTRRGADGYLGVWLVADRATGEKYGSIALLPMPVDQDDTDWSSVRPGHRPDADIEIGYFLKREAWGRGYATEACSRMIEFAFAETPLTEIVAVIDDENDASRSVLEKAGFEYRGRRIAYTEDAPWFRISRDRQPG